MNAYGAWQLSAVLAASVITLAALARGRLLTSRSVLAASLAVVSGLLGARLLKVAFHLAEASEDPALIWSMDFRGLDMAGVVLGGALAGWLLAALLHLPMARLGNAAVPGLAVGMSLSKVGCWVAGCCFGRVYEGLGAVKVAPFSDAHLAEIGAGVASPFGAPRSVFPVQVVEILIPLVALALWFQFNREPSKGPLMFLAVYGVLKALVTFLRFPDAAGDPPLLHLTLYLTPLAIFVLIALKKAIRKREPVTQT